MNDYQWPDLTIGKSESFEVEVTAAMLDGFAAISGDYNPLHMDAAFAQASGYPGRVVFGMLTASFYSRLIGMHLPGKRALLHGIDVEFKAPVSIGDRLTVTGEIAYLNDAYRRLEVKARIVNQGGKVVSKATIRAGLHES
jgi:3-hydroxybutyryl-CoA dehydratase